MADGDTPESDPGETPPDRPASGRPRRDRRPRSQPSRQPGGPRGRDQRPTRSPRPAAVTAPHDEDLPHFSEVLTRDALDDLRQTTGTPERFHSAARALTRTILALAADDGEGAVRAAEDAKRLALRSAAVREALGLALYRTARYREARSELSAAQRFSGNADFAAVLADIERALGRPERAVELFESADTKRMTPDAATELLLVAASAYGDLGRPAAGAALIRRHGAWPAQLRDHHLRLAYAQGTLAEQAGDRDGARRAYERVAAADPDFYDVTDRLRTLNNGSTRGQGSGTPPQEGATRGQDG